MLLVLVEHDRGALAAASLEALTFGRRLAATIGVPLHALTIGDAGDPLAPEAAQFGAEVVHQAHHELLADYGPEAWGDTVAHAAGALEAPVVLAAGTDRGNEAMARAAARLDLPMVANVLEADPATWALTRVRWGGSLLEEAELSAPVALLTTAPLTIEPEPVATPGAGTRLPFRPDLDPSVAATLVRDRVVLAEGVTLATAPVVVGGGRGVGSAEGFAPLEELAALLGGVVGCSRVVTNNGWRPHSDQVGQTGTRIAPALYVACGISGAIQHWVGAMGARRILAVNTDPEANMVAKADYAVIGDLHEVVPAIVAAIRAARG
jgi:electron transfer flavoprotein alpha subunit